MSADANTPASALRRFGAVNVASTPIAAPPDRVCAVFLDRSLWMEGFIKKSVVEGLDNAVGERAIYQTAAGERLEELLVASPPHRFVSRLATVADTDTHAFADWRIAATDTGSVLEFTLYWLDTAPLRDSWAQARALREAYHAHTQGLIDAHLTRIRAVAERAAMPLP